MNAQRRVSTRGFLVALILSFLLALAWSVAAQVSVLPAFDDPHAQTLAAQPAGLTMELRLPKDHFFQGEMIQATLVFRNASHRPFYTWIGTYDRSGRIRTLGFRAVTQTGEPVPDPMKYYFDGGGGIMGGGMGNDKDLGEWEITLPANQWLRFDQPGVYRMYAWSDRVLTGSKDDLPGTKHEPVKLVSAVTTVRIDPLTPAQEQEILTRARADLASDRDQVRREAIERLRYLQTPAAREMLLPLVGKPDALDAFLALASAPSPVAEADRLLAAVKERRIPLLANMFSYYPQLKTGHTGFFLSGPGLPRGPDFDVDLIAAAKASLQDGEWDAVASGTLLALYEHDRFRSEHAQRAPDTEVRALMAAHQLDLPGEVADELLKSFDATGGEDLLPLARRDAAPPRSSALALKLLARLAPDEARPLIVADVKNPPFRLREHFGDSHWGRNMVPDLRPLMSLPAGTRLPELDETLRARLRHPVSEENETDDDLEATMLLAERYGSPALLPDVLRVYLPKEGHCWCAMQNAALRFWLRCNPTAAVEGLRRAMTLRQDTHCYETVLEDTLGREWQPEALPLVLAALEDDSVRVCRSAVTVLGRRAATPAALEKIIVAAERFAARPLPEEPSRRKEAWSWSRWIAGDLWASSGAWKPTRAQWRRLRALPNLEPGDYQQIDERLQKALE